MTDVVDILIIGSGATGAAAAWSLSNNTAFKIACLEQGSKSDAGEYPSTKVDWELARYSSYSPSPNVRGGRDDYPIDDSNSPISIANFNGFGGSTILYSGHFPRFHPSDFLTKTLDGVGEDWPIRYEDLERYFSKNEEMMGVAGLVGDPANPFYERLLPPIPLGAVGEAIARGFNDMGWHWWPSYAAINTHRHNGRAPCINLGPCNLGCSQGAKGSVDVTYWPKALSQGVKIMTNSRVVEITLDKKGLASGAIYIDSLGSECKIFAKVVILACNGVGTPRLLLNSKSSAFPDGLLNEGGLVGRNLMLHPLAYTEAIFEKNLHSSIGPQGCCILSQEFYETSPERNFVRGYTMQVLRGSPPIGSALTGFMTRQIPLGKDHHKKFNSYFNHSVGIAVIAEDLPDKENRIELDYDNCDSDGMPGVKVFYTLGENTKSILKHGMEMSKQIFSAADARVTFSSAPVRHAGWHLMGTARMGLSPRDSVVNKYCQAHSIQNLFVVDSSVFVTSGAVNPVATAQAIALMACDFLKKNFHSLGGHGC